MPHSHDPSSRPDDVWEEVLTDDAAEPNAVDDAPTQASALWGAEPGAAGDPSTAEHEVVGAITEPSPARRRRRRGRGPRAAADRRVASGLGAVILLAAGFAGGVLAQRHRDDGVAGAQTAAFPGAGQLPTGRMPGSGQALGGGIPGGGQAPSGGFGAAAGGNATVGEVVNVRGSTLYVKQTDGTTVRVVSPAGATVQRTAKASMTGVHPGDTVIVSGEADDDGTVEATSVRATSSDASSR